MNISPIIDFMSARSPPAAFNGAPRSPRAKVRLLVLNLRVNIHRQAQIMHMLAAGIDVRSLREISWGRHMGGAGGKLHELLQNTVNLEHVGYPSEGDKGPPFHLWPRLRSLIISDKVCLFESPGAVHRNPYSGLSNAIRDLAQACQLPLEALEIHVPILERGLVHVPDAIVATQEEVFEELELAISRVDWQQLQSVLRRCLSLKKVVIKFKPWLMVLVMAALMDQEQLSRVVRDAVMQSLGHRKFSFTLDVCTVS